MTTVDNNLPSSPLGERQKQHIRPISQNGEGEWQKQIAAKPKSYTGQFLKSYLNGEQEAKRAKSKPKKKKSTA
jgi:hypothetical protein